MDQSKISGLLRISQVLELIPIGKSTWWSGVKNGRFPKGIKLGPNTTVWRIQDIENLIRTLDTDDN